MDPNNASAQSFSASTLSQPPQIFGNYPSDGPPVTPTLPTDLFTETAGFGIQDGIHDFETHDHNDPKRRRIAKACDACRRKKIRCDAKPHKCTNCENYKTECVFTHVERKRNPPKGAKYIEGLENRLGRMESLLRMSGLLSHDDPSATDLSVLEKRLAQRNSSPLSSSSRLDSEKTVSNQGTPKARDDGTPNSISNSPNKHKSGEEPQDPTRKQPEEFEELSDMMCSLMTNKFGETRFIGSSSGFSIFSPRGIQWVSEKTGDDSFQQMINVAAVADNKWFHWKPEVFDDVFARRVFQPLPPREECMSLIKDFFDNFNKMFPLYHEPTFWWLAEKQYSNDPYNGSGWWASLNLAIAMAYRIRVIKTLGLSEDADDNAWLYFKNALSVHSELTIRNTDLFSVQALLGMALFMQGTPNPQPSFNLAGSAIRLAHSIGLHKKASGFGLNKTEIEQRKRVFWIAYLIDKDISLRSGRPPMQDDNDWNVDLPSEEPDDGVGVVPTVDGGKVNLFRKIAEFSVISGKVYARLYSVKASKQSDGELLNTIGELDSELEEWKDSIPLQFRPEHEPNTGDQSLTLQLVTLHFAYYNCLATIHRRSIHHGYWTDRLSDYAFQGLNIQSLNPRVYSSALLCVQAARASINLIKYIPQGDFACVWLILYYPVSSLVTLFANILQNPQDPRARADLKLMSVVVNFLSHICVNEGTGNLQRMHIVCSEFDRIAKVVLDRADREMTVRQKRKQEREKQKVEINPVTAGPQQSLQSISKPSEPYEDSATGHREDAFAQLNGAASNGMFAPEDLRGFGQQQAPDTILANTGIDLNAPWTNEVTQPMNGVTEGLAQSSSPSMPFLGGSGDAGDAAQASNGPFQQPFVPQDLWQMPMTFEWDWQDVMNQMPLDDFGPGSRTAGP